MAANPLPYIITFAIMFLIMLAVLTWVLVVYNQMYSCGLNPNIWCFDDWQCNKVCTPDSPGAIGASPCFSDAAIATGPTGLYGCVLGPDAAAATYCNGTGTTDDTQPLCNCPAPVEGVSNCLTGCATTLGGVGGTDVCCCTNPNNPACAVNGDGQGIGICAQPKT
jgi:hypothetical protein